MTAKLSSYFDKSTAQPHNDHARDFRVAGKSVRCRLQLCDRKGNIRRESSVTTTASATATLDQPRSFILTYYLPDRSLGIYEEHIPNSGVLGGTFLKRGRYRTTPLGAKAPRFFRSSDFYLGAVLVISAHNVMKIVEVDGASFKIMQQCSDEFPFADSKKVTKKFLNNLRDNAPAPLRAMFSHAQVRNDVYQGAIAEDDFIPIVDAHGLCGGMNAQEKLTLAATFRAHVAGGTRPYFTDVHRLCDTLCFQHSTAGTHDLEEVDMDEVAVGAASSVETTQDAPPPGPEFVAQLAHVPVLFRKSFEVAAAKNPTGHLITMPQLAAVLEKSGVKIHDEHFAFLEEQFGNPVDFNALCDAAYFADFAL